MLHHTKTYTCISRSALESIPKRTQNSFYKSSVWVNAEFRNMSGYWKFSASNSSFWARSKPSIPSACITLFPNSYSGRKNVELFSIWNNYGWKDDPLFLSLEYLHAHHHFSPIRVMLKVSVKGTHHVTWNCPLIRVYIDLIKSKSINWLEWKTPPIQPVVIIVH